MKIKVYEVNHEFGFGGTIEAEDLINGVPYNPKLPKFFDDTPNDARPRTHLLWWGIPYIQVRDGLSNLRYEVRCLDGGAWDRSTYWGTFGSIEEAIDCALHGPVWRRDAKIPFGGGHQN